MPETARKIVLFTNSTQESNVLDFGAAESERQMRHKTPSLASHTVAYAPNPSFAGPFLVATRKIAAPFFFDNGLKICHF